MAEGNDLAAGAAAPAATTPPPPSLDPAQPAWDGADLLAVVAAGSVRLTAHRQAVDVLNVFPVPDGDTGSNMSLTLQAAVEAAEAAADTAGRAAGEVAAAVAHGALLNARGNSGVILSQILRGFAGALTGRAEIDGGDLARAFGQAREMAYKAVVEPVEGTLLTVIRGAAERVRGLPAPTPATCLAAALAGAETALAETPALLPILRQAGVVDAGGQGLVHVLAGMARAARGEPPVEPGSNGTTPAAADADQPGAGMAFLDQVAELHGEGAFGYCTNFLVLLAPERPVDLGGWRADLAAMGDSAVIVGDERALKVHLHTADPAAALAYALALGELDQIKIDNMGLQTAALRAQRPAPSSPTTSPPAAPLPPAREPGATAVVAVAAGTGLADALRGMGADAIVSGGQTMNPSVRELLAAVEATGAPEVVLLPNNPNVLLTAEQVPALTAVRVAVVPSRSVPQGLAALSRFTLDDRLSTNLEQMAAALGAVRTVEITEATRTATIDGLGVAVGQTIGLVDDRLVAAGPDPVAVARAALARADVAAAELVTIFPGAGTPEADTTALRDALLADHPDLAVEIHPGDQPHYRFLIAVE